MTLVFVFCLLMLLWALSGLGILPPASGRHAWALSWLAVLVLGWIVCGPLIR